MFVQHASILPHCFVRGARVTERTILTTIRDWIKACWIDEDDFFACNSGTNLVRNNLDQSDVKALFTKWWADNAPRKGELIWMIFVDLDVVAFS